MTGQQPHQRRRNRLTAIVAAGVVVGMVGLAYAAVPLYRLFCQVTGFGGTPQVASAVPVKAGQRLMKIRFNADTARGMPWRFEPEQREITVHVGEEKLAFFSASNPTVRTIVGTATYNVTPLKAGIYFNKVQCFCFTEQTLEPGQQADMPVSFFVDPEIDNDPNLKDVTTITLSYTFFEKPKKNGAAGSGAGSS